MNMSAYVLNIGIIIFALCLSIYCYRRFYSFFSGNKKRIMIDLVQLCALIVAGLLFLNLFFVIMDKLFSFLDLDMWSPLGFDDAFLLFVTTFSVVVIAYFQYKIQDELQKQNQIEAQEKNRQALEREEARKKQEKELERYNIQ